MKCMQLQNNFGHGWHEITSIEIYLRAWRKLFFSHKFICVVTCTREQIIDGMYIIYIVYILNECKNYQTVLMQKSWSTQYK